MKVVRELRDRADQLHVAFNSKQHLNECADAIERAVNRFVESREIEDLAEINGHVARAYKLLNLGDTVLHESILEQI